MSKDAKAFNFKDEEIANKFEILFKQEKINDCEEIKNILKDLGPIILYQEKLNMNLENFLNNRIIFYDNNIKPIINKIKVKFEGILKMRN